MSGNGTTGTDRTRERVEAKRRADARSQSKPDPVDSDPGDSDPVDSGDFGGSDPEPWRALLAAALTAVKAALTTVNHAERVPLFVPAADLFTREYPPTAWRVVGLIIDLCIAMIGAEPKVTKTWLATEIGFAVATGTPVCGEFSTQQGIVAYYYAEDLDRQVRNKLRALAAGRGMAPDAIVPNFYACPRGKFLDVTRDEDLAWIVASCRRIGRVDLLILDPLRDVSSAAEDKSDEMGPVMRRLRLLSELLRCTVLIVHHSGKITGDTARRRPGQKMRGSSAIHGSTDCGLYLGELEGNGSTEFQNTIDSEIKGARSAGRFQLALALEDDANGEAIKATWAVSRTAPKASRQQEAADSDDSTVFDFVRTLAMRGEHLSRRALREHDEAPVSDGRMRVALDRMIESERLRLDGPKVMLPAIRGERGEA